jgi:UDP-N-acetyl-D-mannosaminuronic acid dehydrogenase
MERALRDVVVVGGCGHVGLPLGLAFADRGLQVTLFDTNRAAVDIVNGGGLPFDEPGAQVVLDRTVGTALTATTDPSTISDAEHIVIVIGTPVDEHLNPDPQAVPRAIEALAEHLRDGQLLVLRSTLYPGVTALVERLVERLELDVDVAFCPERIAEGKAMTELYELPQIVASRSQRGQERAATTAPSIGPRSCSGTWPTRSCDSSPKKRSWPSCSPTRGATPSSPSPTSST